MKEYKVSWTDIRGNEICADKVDDEQIEARLYGLNDVILKRFDNRENKYYIM